MPLHAGWIRSSAAALLVILARPEPSDAGDWLRDLQTAAIQSNRCDAAHWGNDPDDYTLWGSHSNRLIPVYTFGTLGGGPGVDLTSYTGGKSPYRSETAVRRIYGLVPTNTVNPQADYCDQTNLYDIQKAAAAAGKKHIFLVVFDGMDWTMTRAAAIAASRSVAYSYGRGMGLHFLDYTAGGTTQFGYCVAAPHNDGTFEDVDLQTTRNPGGKQPGGYDPLRGGGNPWTAGLDSVYLMGKVRTAAGDSLPQLVPGSHCVPDSSATATSLTAGIKTFNGAINVDVNGNPVPTIAHDLQVQGWGVGAVTSVPLSHATPASAYAHNVSRDDFQDIARDLLGLKSIAHPGEPLPGMDVVIGGGYGSIREKDALQGTNFVPGRRYLADDDLAAVNHEHGGRYTVATRAPRVRGAERLKQAADEAAESGTRLLGYYGVGAFEGHLPYRTADGDYHPTLGRRAAMRLAAVFDPKSPLAESYSQADIDENPTLADMTSAAITVLSHNPKGFWLMVEPGDVDWAMHDNNLDNAIGAVFSGDAAVKVITDWVDAHSNWKESLLIVTADHGHLLTLRRPELLIPPADAR